VVETPLTGGADIHARALADRFESLEHLDGRGVVRRLVVWSLIDHGQPSLLPDMTKADP
jgi:hypothetical protein